MKEAEIKVVFDSNILIDVFTERDGSKASIDCFMLAADCKITAYILSKQVTDIYYVLCKYLNQDERRRVIEALVDIFEIVSLDKDDLLLAVNDNGKDFEDNCIIEGAIKCEADYIITNDKKGFENSKIESITPKEFMLTYNK